MYDHSYCHSTLLTRLRKGDFRKVPISARDTFREETTNAAVLAAASIFNGSNPLEKFHLKKKPAYRVRDIKDDLVVRKLAQNLRKIINHSHSSRENLVTNLRHFLEEAVPFRLYRLDIKSFYESFCPADIAENLKAQRKLSPTSFRVAEALFHHYLALGGKGLPRGMAISAVLSDMMMADFDARVFSHSSVYLFGRYVDDIVVITNTTETPRDFLQFVRDALPSGLHLNKKKQTINEILTKLKVGPSAVHQFNVDYLGYRFRISDPAKKSAPDPAHRTVTVDINPSKIKKIKTRIVRALFDFERTGDDLLFIDRIKYLTSNFSVLDKNTGKKKLAGIFFSYPMISKSSTSLDELDGFLRSAILANRGRTFTRFYPILASPLRRVLLSHSFRKGHDQRRFVHFSAMRIHEIQKCWGAE